MGGLPVGLERRPSSLAGGAINVLLAAAAALVLVLAVGPLVLPYRVFTVLSGSMAPAIPVGAEVAGWPAAPGSLRVGDVITFQPPGRPGVYVTHRVAAIDQDGARPQIHTRGDANGAEDPWTLPADRAYLRVFLALPLAGYPLNALSTPLAHGLLVAVLTGSVVVYVVELWRRPA